ncbi:YbaY family lipoprotein [Halomonas sp. WWR20]
MLRHYPRWHPGHFLLWLVIVMTLSGCMTGPRFANLEAVVVTPEPLALPPNAELSVRLEEQTRGGKELIAEGRYTRLRQGPIPVLLRYDRNAVDSGRRYGLEAEIRHAGQRLYTTDKPVPAFTGEASQGAIRIPVERVNR